MRNLPHLAARMYGRPLMLLPGVADIFGNALQQILASPAGVGGAVADTARLQPQRRAHAFAGNVRAGERFADKPYAVTDDGVAVLGVYGALMQRYAFDLATCESFASYEVIGATLDAMHADPDVRAILLEWDSPGGEVAGNFELARRMLAARGGAKPIWSIANEGAYSGAYSLATATDRIIVPQAGSVGSIGVVMVHVDQSKRDERMGVAYTFIYAGERKIDFNSHAPLGADARALATAEVARLYDMFVGHVAAARGLDAKRVRDTEAGIFSAGEAKALGLVDDVAGFDEALAELTDTVRRAGARSFPTSGGSAAATTAKGRTMSDTNQAASTQADPPQGANEAEVAQRVAAASAEARSGERTRIATILRHEQADGRTQLAHTLAFDTDMSVEQAGVVLGAAPKAAAADAPAGASPLAAAMGKVSNPAVGADTASATADAEEDVRSFAANVVALHRQSTGG